MFTQSHRQNSTEYLQGKAIAKHKENKLADALNLYLQSIEVNENQPEWIYGNVITLAAQISNFDLGIKLKEQALNLYSDSGEICRAIALLHDKMGQAQEAITFYKKSISIDVEQPEWVYIKLLDLLIEKNLFSEANQIKQQGLKQFPNSSFIIKEYREKITEKAEAVPESSPLSNNHHSLRITPKSIDSNVDLNIEDIRLRLMDSAIVTQFEVLLEQILFNGERGLVEMDTDALVHCLAEIKTDIHYLKTKLLEPSAEIVDPQAREGVDISRIVETDRQIPLKCDLSKRIIGSGWHDAEQHGRWTGSGTLSSIVLPYPQAGRYRLEIVIRAEAKVGLLRTLTVAIGDRPVDILIDNQAGSFPTIITQEVEIISDVNNSFLGIDLTIAETVAPQAKDSRLIGLLVESINLIPLE